MAKAPIPGLVKTRLAATVGYQAAAELASLALLDSIEACNATGYDCHLALAGSLATAVGGSDLTDALAGWRVFDQVGDGFGDRLAHAHASTPGPVLQIGMDTPQLTAANLSDAALALDSDPAVLGPATDGGWWLLGLRDPAEAACLADVPMSTPQTGELTRDALIARGLRVALTSELEDVDTSAEAERVAAIGRTRFGRAWQSLVVAQ